ncbi:MAG: endonuclease III [delta proteobacterium ML8_F1]|nr:MAG: endonuclease III [delta proteobacterium ML8_F1]
MDEKTRMILKTLDEMYPEAMAELDFRSAYELLVATVLSAQCTDVRVNLITAELFKEADTPERMVALGVPRIRESIKTCGMYQMKSKYLYELSRILVERFDSQVPRTIEELTQLPGVGRKTANVVVSNAFGVPAIAVDTHVFRVSNRLGLARAREVRATEEALMAKVPRERWTKLHHQLIFLGRRICKARSPLCEECPLKGLCDDYQKRSIR